MAWKMNQVKASLNSYPPYLIMGLPKVGKTTLFRDLVLYNYHDAKKGLLISFGDEEGYNALDKLQYEVAEEWDMEEDERGNRGVVQIVDDLVENKEKYGIEMVGLDTLDAMVDVSIQEVYEIHRRLKGSYPESLNSALNGYHEGQKRTIALILEQVSKLRKVGYAVFIIGHVKRKDKIDMATGEVFEHITNDLMSTYYNPIAKKCQMIVNIITEFDFDSDGTFKEKEVMASNGKKVKEIVEVKKRNKPTRMMYFRDNGIVDAGGRFVGLPEKLELSAENFMKAFEIGVKNSLIDKEMTDEEMEERKKQEQKEIEDKSRIEKDRKKKDEETKLLNEKKKEITDFIKSKAQDLTPEQLVQMKAINKEYNIKDYKDPSVIDIEALEKILSIIQ